MYHYSRVVTEYKYIIWIEKIICPKWIWIHIWTKSSCSRNILPDSFRLGVYIGIPHEQETKTKCFIYYNMLLRTASGSSWRGEERLETSPRYSEKENLDTFFFSFSVFSWNTS